MIGREKKINIGYLLNEWPTLHQMYLATKATTCLNKLGIGGGITPTPTFLNRFGATDLPSLVVW